ncbi:MAG: hypothetical protein GTO08_09620 [Deltaproteobacteria bacterium]|nr:hypothetical protein [Deltaproteobacteria bacterium]
MIQKRDLHFILMMVLVVGILVVFSLSGKPRLLPADEAHRTATSDTRCLECHGKSSDYPMSDQHPPRDTKCYLCHKKSKG